MNDVDSAHHRRGCEQMNDVDLGCGSWDALLRELHNTVEGAYLCRWGSRLEAVLPSRLVVKGQMVDKQ